MDELKCVSVYYLLLELFDGGKLGILPDLEPISEDRIIRALEEKSGQTFATDKKAWANWFLFESDIGSRLERENFLIFLADMEFTLS